MNAKYFIYPIVSTIVSVIIYYNFFPSVLELCELKTCPYCFGTDFCEAFQQNKITLQYDSVNNFIYNIFSVKNVYFSYYEDRKVVLKKLAHNSELRKLSIFKQMTVKDLIKYLISNSDIKHFKVCDKKTATLFLDVLKYKDIKNLQTLLHINVEPVLLEIFNSEKGWRVPTLYGYCGQLVIVENMGQPLNNIQNFDWFDRVFVAHQILEAVIDFTDKHAIFRFYLTDISPDNIVINEDLKVTFIDLENVVLKAKDDKGLEHYSEHFDEDSYIYSERQLCGSSISDHNIYSTCRLLLSKNAPWPMMKNGLLHDPPEIIMKKFNELFLYIELCVYSPSNINRFKLSQEILKNLNYILRNYTKYLVDF